MIYKDRVHAGRELARALEKFRGIEGVVLGISAGGRVLASQVSNYLRLPEDMILIGKLIHPWHTGLEIGAVTESGFAVLNEEEACHLSCVWLEEERQYQARLLKQLRERVLRNREIVPLEDKTVLLIDEGIGTTHTAEAGVRAAREGHAAHVVIAAPVAECGCVRRLANVADEVVVLQAPQHFGSVDSFYLDPHGLIGSQTNRDSIVERVADQTADIKRSLAQLM